LVIFAALILALFPQGAPGGPEAGAGPGAAGAAEPAFLEVSLPPGPAHVGELVPVELRFGFERSFLDGQLIQLFRQPLDLPVQLELPWGAAGLLPAADDAAASLRFALDDGLGRAAAAGAETREGREFTVFVHRRHLLVSEAGELELPGPSLRFASATEFVDDLLQGRVPVDRIEGRVDAPPQRLQVLPLPEQGRPPGFGGAVGRFRMSATVTDAELEAGQSLELRLRIEGDGLLDAVPAPSLTAVEGFHVLGQVREAAEGALVYRYELQPLAGAAPELPPIVLAFFDPVADAYRVTRTEAVPLSFPAAATQHPMATGGAVEAEPSVTGSAESDGGSVAAPASAPSTATKLMMVALFLGPVAIVGLIFLGWQRRRRPATSAQGTDLPPAADPEPVPPTSLDSQSGARSPAPSEVSDPLESEMMTLLGCTASALVRPDLAATLRRAGVAPGLAQQCAACHQDRVAQRYGAPESDPEEHDLRQLLDALRRAGG